jgi:hypothetical protein
LLPGNEGKPKEALEMKEDPRKLPLLGNFAIRIRELERLCGITSEASVTNRVEGIPVKYLLLL